jgi:pimeloyl-ACP methyl ester carboxylesterase
MKDFPEVWRTRFGDIVAEFILPARESNKVIILAAGAPGYPGNREALMHFLSQKGYWVFLPRYRGTWESDGHFLEFPPHEDLLHIMDEIPKGFIELWSGSAHAIPNPEFYLIGGSFGGAAALLASRDDRVAKAVTISAVVDWREQENTIEPLELMSTYVPAAWGNGYREQGESWKKLLIGDFYNPAWEVDSILGVKVLMFHHEDDKVVPFEPAKQFAESIVATFVPYKQGGHRALGVVNEPKYWSHIEKFFKINR